MRHRLNLSVFCVDAAAREVNVGLRVDAVERGTGSALEVTDLGIEVRPAIASRSGLLLGNARESLGQLCWWWRLQQGALGTQGASTAPAPACDSCCWLARVGVSGNAWPLRRTSHRLAGQQPAAGPARPPACQLPMGAPPLTALLRAPAPSRPALQRVWVDGRLIGDDLDDLFLDAGRKQTVVSRLLFLLMQQQERLMGLPEAWAWRNAGGRLACPSGPGWAM